MNSKNLWSRNSNIHRSSRYTAKLLLEFLEDRALPSTSAVTTFGGDAQHTAIFQPAAQNLSVIRWHAPVDLNPQYTSGGDLLIHYGAPLMTSANTVIVPVKTGATDGFEVNTYNGASGAFMYSLSTDYILPSHSWTPSYSPALLITPAGTRLYYAGAGGTVYYVTNPDSSTPGTPVHQVFYTTLANYQANASAFNSTVFINTPITSDSNGDIFFGFRVQNTAPAPLSTTQSGFARIDANGYATYVLAGTAAGDGNIALDSHNSAPALSNDGSTLYVLVKSSSTIYYGYLLALDSTTLATKHKIFLLDPRPGVGNAGITDNSTASPMVAPDGTVFVGVFAPNYDGSRGWMLHFSADLTTEYTPGAFGWDDTDAIVPSSMVPQYTGTSSYLVFSKYNNYASTETGSTGGDGVNMVSILDPNSTETDPRNDGTSPIQVMREVLTVPGPTPDPGNISTTTNPPCPHAVREWCINTAAVDPALGAIFFPSEDGNLYEWLPGENSLTQAIKLGTGIGEAYVPTVIGPDGTVYSINNATLFAVGNQSGQTVSLTSSAPSLQSVIAGQSITFTAGVSNTSGSGFTPTGTITFKDGTTVLATVTLDNTGHATYTTTSLPGNSTYPWAAHFISAGYSGDTHFSAGTAILMQSVHRSGTTTTVTSSPNASTFGQAVTFTATVSPVVSGLGAVTGLVTFEEGTTVLGAAGVNSSGAATLTTAALGAGSHTITAVYYSDLVYATSSGDDSASPQVVNKANTTTAVDSSSSPTVSGQSVTITATVTVNSPGSQTAANPTGTVTFYDGGVAIGTGSLSNSAADTATFTTSTLSATTHTITAAYSSGDANFNASPASASISQVVNKDATSNVLTSSPNPSSPGQAVTLTAIVTANAPGSGIPTGTVTFKTIKSTLATVTLNSAGHATFTTSSLPVGTTTLTAVYNGDGNFLASSGNVAQSVTSNKKNTTTTLASSLNPSRSGQAVTFTATVTPMGSGTPTGIVTFYDNKVSVGTSTLNSSGMATFTTSSLAVGNQLIFAKYNGDSNFNSSMSALLTQTVNSATTVTLLTAGPAAEQLPINPAMPLTSMVITWPVAAGRKPANSTDSLAVTTTPADALVERLAISRLHSSQASVANRSALATRKNHTALEATVDRFFGVL
jgi:hypothetical protein